MPCSLRLSDRPTPSPDWWILRSLPRPGAATNTQPGLAAAPTLTVPGSIVVVELVLEVLGSLCVGSGLIIEHVHLSGVFVDNGVARHFLRALGHCRLMARIGNRRVGFLYVAGLQVDSHDLAIVEFRYPRRLRLAAARLGSCLSDYRHSGGDARR